VGVWAFFHVDFLLYFGLQMILSKLKKLLLVLGDFGVLYLSLYLTLALRYRHLPGAEIWNQHFMPFTVLFLLWALTLYINGLYENATSKNDIEFYNKLLRNLLVNFALAAAYFYLLTNRLFNIKPFAVFFIYIGVSLVLVSLWRFWYNSFVQRPNLLRNVLLIGMKDEARELVLEIIRKPQLGYHIAAIVHEGYRNDEDFPGVAFYDTGIDLKKLLREHTIQTVVTSINPHSNPELVQSLYESLALKMQFYDLPTFYEKLTGKIPVTTIGHVWFLENLAEGDKSLYELFKRITDIALAALGLVISAPFLPIFALLIQLDTKGPVFFRQVRIGLLGKPFEAIKLRSMIVGAEKNGAQWAERNDPRVTRLGKYLRRFRFDEIPQLWNVLKGEMTFIGPRPERPEFVANLQTMIPFYNERHLVKPGLTGWAQINFQKGSTAGDALKKLQYDLFYIKNRSLPLDIGVLLKTINLILTGKGW